MILPTTPSPLVAGFCISGIRSATSHFSTDAMAIRFFLDGLVILLFHCDQVPVDFNPIARVSSAPDIFIARNR